MHSNTKMLFFQSTSLKVIYIKIHCINILFLLIPII